MEATERKSFKGRVRIAYLHQEQPIDSASSAILDAMNITIDKPPTLQALQNAEATFLRFAVEARKLSREDIAKYWEQEARWITALREQIATHGKASNGEEKPN